MVCGAAELSSHNYSLSLMCAIYNRPDCYGHQQQTQDEALGGQEGQDVEESSVSREWDIARGRYDLVYLDKSSTMIKLVRWVSYSLASLESCWSSWGLEWGWRLRGIRCPPPPSAGQCSVGAGRPPAPPSLSRPCTPSWASCRPRQAWSGSRWRPPTGEIKASKPLQMRMSEISTCAFAC